MKTKYTTTKRDFSIFKREVEQWIRLFNLGHLRWMIKHEGCHREERAWYLYFYKTYVAHVGLARNWRPDRVTTHRIKLCAFHEVAHIFLEALREPKDFNETVEPMMKVLENLIFGIGD